MLSSADNFTIGTNSNLTEILANVVKVGTDTSNVTFSIPQDISSSYNLILPVRQGASGESLVYSEHGQLVWRDPTVLKQVISVYGPNLSNDYTSSGTHSTPTYLDNYIASINPKSSNSKIFIQFKVNYHASLSASNQISFYIKKTHDGNETIFSESLFGPYNGAGGFTGQYISNLLDQSSSTNTITYQLGYQINGNVAFDDVVGILGYDSSYNNSILLQEFEGSGTAAVSVWNKGVDSNGLYYNDGTVHIGSTKNALDSQNTIGVALELSGNLVGTNANFTGNVTGDVTGNLVGNVTGDVTGNVYGVLTGFMTMTGHILPDTNAVYDIGSAEYKVRHMYLSNNSLWIGDEHKATINPSNNQLEFRRRKTDAIPQSFIAAGINDISQILTAAGEASLSNMSLGKWNQAARTLGITINGKTGLDIDSSDIFDTGNSDDWQPTLDVETIADDVTSLQGDIININSSILNINDDIYTAQTNISSLQTSVESKQNRISTTSELVMKNLTLSGYLRGPTNMIIDPATYGDDKGLLTVKGSLQVLGTTTTINSETLTINDNSIILNNNYSGSSPTENASIEIERGNLDNAIIQWNETNDQWEFYREGTDNLSSIKCDTINCDTVKVGITHQLGSISATVSGSILTINGNTSISYGVYSFSGNITLLTTANFNYVSVNSQYIIYYTNNSGSVLTINNTIANCKTNLSEALTVSNGNSVLFCITAIGSNYIMTISQLY